MPLIDPLSSILAAFESASLSPVPVPTFAPTALLKITWPSGAEALLGNALDAAQLSEEPTVELFPVDVPALEADTRGADEAGAETTYTLAMLDPDAPSREDPKYGSFRHWVVRRPSLPVAPRADTADRRSPG
jgi:hypothetical protein